MTLQEQYDAAMFEFSRGEYAVAADRLKALLAQDGAYFDAQLALGILRARERFPADFRGWHNPQRIVELRQLGEFAGERFHQPIAEGFGLAGISHNAERQHGDFLFGWYARDPPRGQFPNQDRD